MNVEARSQKIENILKKGTFIIPDYQREYDWDSEEVDEFLEDIEETNNGDSYFIGHMVMEGEYNGASFNVIDGQQRFTTITIILSVIRDIFYNRDETDLAEGINDNYIFGKDRNNKSYIILENKMPYPILQAYVQSIPAKKNSSVKPIKRGEKRIKKIYDKLYKLFDSYTIKQLEDIRNKILDLEVIFVAVSDEVDAFTIFETLNATGKDLTPIDLIKNQIFKLYDRQPHIDEPNDSWKEILSNSENKNLKFLNNFWSSRYKKVSNNKIYKQFIDNIVKTKVNIVDFLEELKSDSVLFKEINYPNKENWTNPDEYKIYFSLNAIVEIFNIEVANSILLSLLREYKSKKISLKYLLKALNAIEKYHFINNAISSNRSSGLDTMYARFARDIKDAKDKHHKHTEIDKMIKRLDEKLPIFKEYNANVDEKLYYSSSETKQKKLVQYVLKKIEFHFQKNSIEIINPSLEHIYPEKPTKDWKTLKNEVLLKNIGNLVLLDANLNSKIGNKKYSIKKKIVLKESTILSTKEVFNNVDEWSDSEIKNRRNSIVELMYNDVWNA